MKVYSIRIGNKVLKFIPVSFVRIRASKSDESSILPTSFFSSLLQKLLLVETDHR
jgi:hypothetical protein